MSLGVRNLILRLAARPQHILGLDPLVELLGRECPIPCTYAGGARSLDDLARVSDLSGGRVDLTYGSALDLFGGNLVKYADCVAWNRRAGD